MKTLKRFWIAILGASCLIPTNASAQVVNYHMGTILGNGTPQGYHVGTVGIGNFNDRLSLRAATFTPWEFGEIWVGFIGEWVVPKSQKFQADLLFSLGIVGRIDGNFQPLKNLRPALTFGVGF